jgi:bacteriorhodopsin
VYHECLNGCIFKPTISAFMEVSNTFIPTAGVVGLLPMVTYFFLVVAMFAFIVNFIFALSTQSIVPSGYRIAHTLTAVIAVVAGISYYVIQSYYHDMLAELATVTDINDRQTLIRESYNTIGQYRYMAWFITSPLLLIQVVFRLNLQLSEIKRPLAALLMAAVFMDFASYIGHQQLSFDNEIDVGMKVVWGLIATIDFVIILFTLNRLWNQFSERADPQKQRAFRLMALTTVMCWGLYLLGYFLTVAPIDLNWIHLIFTITDLVSYVVVALVIYFSSLKPLKQ